MSFFKFIKDFKFKQPTNISPLENSLAGKSKQGLVLGRDGRLHFGKVASKDSGGVSSFLELNDTPQTYDGFDGFLLLVKDNKITFIDPKVLAINKKEVIKLITIFAGGDYFMNKQVKYDMDSEGNIVFMGIADPNVAPEEPKWNILKFFYDGQGNLLHKEYADGKDDYSRIWVRRNLYNYYPKYKKRRFEYASYGLKYIGEAYPGVIDSDYSWLIKKYWYENNLLFKGYASGVDLNIFSWEHRDDYVYGVGKVEVTEMGSVGTIYSGISLAGADINKVCWTVRKHNYTADDKILSIQEAGDFDVKFADRETLSYSKYILILEYDVEGNVLYKGVADTALGLDEIGWTIIKYYYSEGKLIKQAEINNVIWDSKNTLDFESASKIERYIYDTEGNIKFVVKSESGDDVIKNIWQITKYEFDEFNRLIGILSPDIDRSFSYNLEKLEELFYRYIEKYAYIDNSANVEYEGKTVWADETEAKWLIKKYIYDNGEIVAENYAENSADYNKKFSEKEIYTYE